MWHEALIVPNQAQKSPHIPLGLDIPSLLWPSLLLVQSPPGQWGDPGRAPLHAQTDTSQASLGGWQPLGTWILPPDASHAPPRINWRSQCCQCMPVQNPDSPGECGSSTSERSLGHCGAQMASHQFKQPKGCGKGCLLLRRGTQWNLPIPLCQNKSWDDRGCSNSSKHLLHSGHGVRIKIGFAFSLQ